MPNYDLRCVKCSIEHKISASMKAKSEMTIPCPSCGSFDLETIFRSPPAVVKGKADFACPSSSRCGSACPHAG